MRNLTLLTDLYELTMMQGYASVLPVQSQRLNSILVSREVPWRMQMLRQRL